MPKKKTPKVKVPKGDPEKGQQVFESECTTCHALEGDDRNAAAPNLSGILKRKAAARDFPYSNSLKKSGIKWNAKHMFKYLEAPGKYVPGNRMAYGGIKDKQTRADLIAYLKIC